MAAFEYQALSASGKREKGVLEADTPKQVRQLLRDKGLTPLDVRPVIQKSERSQRQFRLGSGVKMADLALATRQLATLVESALPLEEALKAVAEQVEQPKLQSMLMAIRARVVEGHTLADALAEFPQTFDTLFRSMVAAGEKSGHLAPVLSRLADYQEKQQATRARVKLALLYPSVLVVIALAVVSGLLVYVVPKIVAQFTSLGGELPALTRGMLALSDFLIHKGWLVLLVTGAAYWLWKQWLRRPDNRRRLHLWLLRLPIVGKVIRGLNSARLARTLAITTSSGVPLLDGLTISAKVLTNLVLQDAVKQAAVRVREGASLHRALAETGQFPPIMLHMIASGERSGELETMLARIAESQEREFETVISVALGLMEPLVIVFMGAVVLMIVLAILLPIFQMNSLVTQ
jgi:general secretion pathway protein F